MPASKNPQKEKERRKKISKALKGRKGRVWTNEQRKKRSEINKKIGLIPPLRKGIILTEKTRRKMSEARKGKRNPNWNGGVTSLIQQIRNCFKYRQWRSDIFTKDNFTCQLCGHRKSGELNVDHYPKMFSVIFYENKIKTLEEALDCEEFWNINNGRTLCKNCHIKYGEKNHLSQSI